MLAKLLTSWGIIQVAYCLTKKSTDYDFCTWNRWQLYIIKAFRRHWAPLSYPKYQGNHIKQLPDWIWLMKPVCGGQFYHSRGHNASVNRSLWNETLSIKQFCLCEVGLRPFSPTVKHLICKKSLRTKREFGKTVFW